MKRLSREFLSAEFASFVIVGGFAALVNFFSRIVFSRFLPYPAAIVCAYLIGMATAYLLARKFVFGAGEQGIVGEMYRFVLVNLLAVLQTLVVSLLLNYTVLPWFGVSMFREEIAHLFGVCVPVFTSYVGHKYWTFDKRRAPLTRRQ